MRIGMEIKCCPLCGGRIVVSNLYQYSLDYTMRKDGKIGKRYKRGDDGAVDALLLAKIIKPVMHDGKKKNFPLNLTELFTTISTARMNKWQSIKIPALRCTINLTVIALTVVATLPTMICR